MKHENVVTTVGRNAAATMGRNDVTMIGRNAVKTGGFNDSPSCPSAEEKRKQRKENYDYKKRVGLCTICGKKHPKGEGTRCQSCRETDRKRAKIYYHDVIKKRMSEDPEFADKRRKRNRDSNREFRKRHIELGQCTRCDQPSYQGHLCKRHWEEHAEYYRKSRPDAKSFPVRDDLPVPPVENNGSTTDVGKIISLHNAGWRSSKIAAEVKISNQRVSYWIRKARKVKEEEHDEKRKE